MWPYVEVQQGQKKEASDLFPFTLVKGPLQISLSNPVLFPVAAQNCWQGTQSHQGPLARPSLVTCLH